MAVRCVDSVIGLPNACETAANDACILGNVPSDDGGCDLRNFTMFQLLVGVGFIATVLALVHSLWTTLDRAYVHAIAFADDGKSLAAVFDGSAILAFKAQLNPAATGVIPYVGINLAGDFIVSSFDSAFRIVSQADIYNAISLKYDLVCFTR